MLVGPARPARGARTDDAVSRRVHAPRSAGVGARAARALTAEFARHNAATTALVVGADHASPVVAAAVEALLPGDTLTLVAGERSTADLLRDHITGLGSWIADRVKIVDSLAEADPADVVIVGEPLTGTAEEARALLDGLGKYLTDGAVVTVATPAVPGRTGGAAAELFRQSALFGVGSDLVRAQPAAGAGAPAAVHPGRRRGRRPTLAPAYRPSSVPLTRTHAHRLERRGRRRHRARPGRAGPRRPGPSRSCGCCRRWPPRRSRRSSATPSGTCRPTRAAVVAASDGRVLSVERMHRRAASATASSCGSRCSCRCSTCTSTASPVAGRVADYFVERRRLRQRDDSRRPSTTWPRTRCWTPTHGTVVVAQRTGLIARRIVQRAPVGTLVARGERMGLIRFGSRTDVYLPADRAEPLVAAGRQGHRRRLGHRPLALTGAQRERRAGPTGRGRPVVS